MSTRGAGGAKPKTAKSAAAATTKSKPVPAAAATQPQKPQQRSQPSASRKRSHASITRRSPVPPAFPTASLDTDEANDGVDDLTAAVTGLEEGNFEGFPDLVDAPPSDADDHDTDDDGDVSDDSDAATSSSGDRRTTEDVDDDSDELIDEDSDEPDDEDELEEEDDDDDSLAASDEDELVSNAMKTQLSHAKHQLQPQLRTSVSAKPQRSAAKSNGAAAKKNQPSKQQKSSGPSSSAASKSPAATARSKRVTKTEESESNDTGEIELDTTNFTRSAHLFRTDDDDVDTDRPFIEPDAHPAELSDSSDDEGVTGQELRYKNRVGNIPLEWYKDYDHIGYNVSGQAITRQSHGVNGAIDQFLAMMDRDKNSRSVYDAVNDEWIQLNDSEIHSLNRLRHGGYAHTNFDPYFDYTGQAFTENVRLERLGNAQEPKARFIPSKHESKRVVKLIRALRHGWIKTDEQIAEEKRKERENKSKSYLLWGDDGQLVNDTKMGLHRMPVAIPAPKQALPGHAHSYNPPSEYLFSAKELEAWQRADPSDRTLDFVPQKFSSMREIPAYQNLLKERFERCLDLYLAPRVRRKKFNVGDPESLIPSLPKPSELKPFPTMLSLVFAGHTGRIRSICVSPSGEWLVSGAEDGTVRLWEIATGRCFKKWDFNFFERSENETKNVIVEHVAFNPDPSIPVFTVCIDRYVVLLRHGYGKKDDEKALDVSMRTITEAQRDIIEKRNGARDDSVDVNDDSDEQQGGVKRRDILWRVHREKRGKIEGLKIRPLMNYDADDQPAVDDSEASVDDNEAVHEDDGSSVTLVLTLPAMVTHVAWHAKGDYFSSAVALSQSISHVHIHRLSSHSSHSPFTKSKGLVTGSVFHPSQPIFFLSTKVHIFVYHLLQQKLLKKLSGNIAHISSLSLHPSGDHCLVSGFDRKVSWFDLDMGNTPYKTLKYHSKAVRHVGYHRRWPLFASISDDGTAHVFHATVYDDLLTNPLIVPVKILRGHNIVDGISGMACAWHATQPWLLTAGADQTIKLWV